METPDLELMYKDLLQLISCPAGCCNFVFYIDLFLIALAQKTVSYISSIYVSIHSILG
jgi:hypothetical protein